MTNIFDDTGSRFVLLDSFGFEDPDNVSDSVVIERGLQADGIVFNPETETIFVVRTDDPDGAGGPEPRVQSVLQFETNGNYINEFNFDAVGVPVGITALPKGNLLVTAVNPVGPGVFEGKLLEVTTDGTLPTDGITIDLPDAFNDRNQRGLVVGVTYADKGTEEISDDSILVITSRSQEIVEFDLSGNELFSLDLSEYGLTAPQGLAIDPTTGNIFVADEAESAGGTNKIYEITPISEDFVVGGQPRLGELVSIIDTSEKFGFDDPEGLSVDENGLVYVAFDGDDPGEVGNQVATFALNNNPIIDTEEQIQGTDANDAFVASLLPDTSFDGNNDTVLTFSGNDVVDAAGGFGGNRISTGSGDDIIYVSRNDKAFGASGDDTFFTTGGSGNTLSGGSGDDEFYLSSGDRVLGGSGDDTFFGADGSNNRISGGSGDDTFFIGSGDSVFGGTGADAFWITSGDLPIEASTIGGFEFDVDVIGVIGFTFDDLGFDGNTISIDGVEVANVVGVDTASLSESDFVFV